MLRIGEGASADEVQSAFRRRVREVHPDVKSGTVSAPRNEPSIDQLRAARTVMLSPRPVAKPKPAPVAAPPPPPATAPPRYYAKPVGHRPGIAGALFGIVLAAMVIVIGIIAVASRSDGGPTDATPANEPRDCLLIDEDGVATAATCTTPGALRITSEGPLGAACLPSQIRLETGESTFCLSQPRQE